MKHLLNQSENQTSRSRGGFTLVELLVVISIFVILLSLTAGMVFVTRDSDRIAACSRSVQAFLEGGRIRAYKIKELNKDVDEDISAIGLRIYRDPNDWFVATSMAYIVQQKEKGSLTVRTIAADPSFMSVRYEADGVQWFGTPSLNSKSFLQVGSNVRINPTGNTFEDWTVRFIDVGDQELDLFRQGTPFGYTTSTGTVTVTYDYEITLPPTLLADSQPILLPKGTVIDLKSSSTFLPSTCGLPVYRRWVGSTAYDVGDRVYPNNYNGRFFIVTTAGTSGSSEPSWNTAISATTNDGSVEWTTPAEPPLSFDIMFSNQGTVIGPAATKGVLRLVLAMRRDTDLGLDAYDLFYNQDDDGPANAGNTPILADARLRGEVRIVSFYTQSGMVTVSPFDPTALGSNSYRARDPFRYAKEGGEAK